MSATNGRPSKDDRYVSGAVCTWHGPIQEAKASSASAIAIPGCPHCEGPLYQYASRAEWDRAAARFAEKQGEPEYPAWLESLRSGRCKPLAAWDWRADLEAFKSRPKPS